MQTSPQRRPPAARTEYHDLVRHDAIALLPEAVGKVLDFGGGIGATGAYLKECGDAVSVVLFDQVASSALPAIDAAEALDFDDEDAVARLVRRHGPFDTVLALDVLEHLRDPWRTISILAGGLRPDGRMLVSLPNAATLSIVGPLIAQDRFDYVDAGVLDRTHLRWFTRKTAAAMIEDTGLVVRRSSANPFRRRDKLLNLVTLGLLKRFLAKQWIFLATR